MSRTVDRRAGQNSSVGRVAVKDLVEKVALRNAVVLRARASAL